jgi:serine/threonine-protein kinase
MQAEQPGGAISFAYLAEIAVGATARVDLCRTSDGRLLAIKRLHPHIAEDPGFATQFLDEVWMTASLKHPNVVEVAGWGTDDQGSYLAVELVQGVSLARLMKTVFDTGEQFTERMVVYVCAKLCAGLAAAHNLRSPDGELLQLVHRDLTPGNVLVGFDGDVKIADFGLAKAKLRLTKTMTGMAKGQPTYMAPEQAKALDIDKRADVFSLGVVLFELFSGRRPWLGSSDYEMMQRTANDPPADLRELRAKIDKELVAIVNKCLEKSPDARFQSAEEVQARLDEWLTVHGYQQGSKEAVARFVRRNAMRQMRWFERAVAGELAPQPVGRVGRGAAAGRDASYGGVVSGSLASDARRASATEAARPLDPRQINGYARPPVIVDETTDVSDAPQLMPLSPAPQSRAEIVAPDTVAPSTRASAVDARVPSQSDSDWGEEIPTLVQREGKPVEVNGRARGGAGVGRRRPMGSDASTPRQLPSILDEESDSNRTTAIKSAASSASALPRLHTISDMDSETAPTVPTPGGAPIVPGQPRPAAGARPSPPVQARANDAGPGAQGAPRPGKSIPPGVAVPMRGGRPGGAAARGPTGAPGQRPPSQAPRAPGRVVSASPDVPPPPQLRGALVGGRAPDSPPQQSPAALARSAGEAVRAAVFAATAEHARVSHATQDDMSPAPMALRRPQFDDGDRGDSAGAGRDVSRDARSAELEGPPPVHRLSPSDRPPSEELVVAEADRLAIEAVRLADEARAAQARADKKAQQANLASEAAAIAAEAVRMLRAHGLGAASARLDDARRVEASIASTQEPQRGGARMSQTPPPYASGPMPRPSQAPPAYMQQQPPQQLQQPYPHPQSVTPPPTSYAGQQPTTPYPQQGQPQHAPSMPPPPMHPSAPPPGYGLQLDAYGRPSSPPGRPGFPDSFGVSNDVGRPPFMRSALGDRLRGAFGMTSAAVFVLAAVAFVLVFVVLWVIWG